MDTGPTSPAGTPYGDISDLLARMGGEDEGEYASITETVSSNRGKADIFVDVAAAIEKRVFGK